MTATPRIALIHATALAVEPIQAAFARHWPGVRLMNLLDDSLSVDRAQAGTLTPEMVQRFIDLADYTKRAGSDAILFTCSAFGVAIEAAGAAVSLPTLKPNEAMFDDALTHCAAQAEVAAGRPARMALIATFEASLGSMATELKAMAAQRNQALDLQMVFVPEAMQDLADGKADLHHRKIADAARALQGSDVVMLAQFSMAAAQPATQAMLTCPVLSSPDCAVLALRKQLQA
jgi:hypothetical protein